jgi:hypothetical protein
MITVTQQAYAVIGAATVEYRRFKKEYIHYVLTETEVGAVIIEKHFPEWIDNIEEIIKEIGGIKCY